MFYSHEILTSRQYGVATIWLVATVGNKSGTTKITRKAIQEVDVQKACEKILEPGAPIALRLQGNLLYGVSRVYSQQCAYMLTDAQKIQVTMNLFFKQFGASHVDPDAGRARPENLMIMDDPEFIAMPQMPDFNPEDLIQSQHTNKTSSQMSPHTLNSQNSQRSLSSGPEQFSIQLDLAQHSTPGASPNRLQGLQGLSSTQKPGPVSDGGNIFGEDELVAPNDYGIEIDEFGNIVETGGLGIVGANEPELPPMPRADNGANAPAQPVLDDQGDFLMMDEEHPLPDAEALPGRQQPEKNDQHDVYRNASDESQQAPAPKQRRKRKAKLIHADERTEISRNVLKEWQADYQRNCGGRKHRPVTQAQARENAIHLTFGLGVNNIGQSLGIPSMVHPLVMEFSGDALFTAMTGLEILDTKGRGHKRDRSASELIEDSQENRRVRPKTGDTPELGAQQQGRGTEDDHVFDLGTDGPELGREAQAQMDDVPSSAMPWNRSQSFMPGSSIRGRPGSAQPHQFGRDQPSSPLAKRGSVQDIHRYSDDMPMGGDDFGAYGPHSGDSIAFDEMAAPADERTRQQEQQQQQTESQYARAALDREGQNFLSFVENEMVANGERRHAEDYALRRKWLNFDDVFVPEETSRNTAAQAFYHVLTLVTKGKLVVEQQRDDEDPYAPIHVGIQGA